MNKFNYIRDTRILEFCRTLSCQACMAEDGTVVAAHSNQAKHGKGRGIKASDQYVAALCYRCHYMIDQGRESRDIKVAIWDAAHDRTKKHLKAAGLWPESLGGDVPDAGTVAWVTDPAA